jgi:acetyl-CoA carboxylase beta subunit
MRRMISSTPSRELRNPPHRLTSPAQGVVTDLLVAPGEAVRAGQTLMVLEAMKMAMPIDAPVDGHVGHVGVGVGDTVVEGEALAEIHASPPAATATAGPAPASGVPEPEAGVADAPVLRRGAERLARRRALLADAARPEAVARRHAGGRWTAREGVAALLDPGSLVEYGGFAIAAQRSRRDEVELQQQTPADGLITGIGTVDGRPVAVMAYDYTVLAGTQGSFNHRKSDRLLELVARQGLPLVLWAEGGGGRPGDVDSPAIAGLHCSTFRQFAALSGQVPVIGLVGGRCFAGNAALLGCCDLVVARAGSSIGMGGPAMIEGGGLGRVEADAVGPAEVLAEAGAVDLIVEDDAALVSTARCWPCWAASRPPIRAPAPCPARWRRPCRPSATRSTTCGRCCRRCSMPAAWSSCGRPSAAPC